MMRNEHCERFKHNRRNDDFAHLKLAIDTDSFKQELPMMSTNRALMIKKSGQQLVNPIKAFPLFAFLDCFLKEC